MLSGGWSPGYFAETGHQLADAVPAVSFAVVPGQLHEGPIRPGNRLALRTARFLLGGPGGASPAPGRGAGSMSGSIAWGHAADHRANPGRQSPTHTG